MIKLRLRVTSIDPPGEEDGQDYPVVTFKGTSWSLHSSWDPNANSLIRGESSSRRCVCCMSTDELVCRMREADAARRDPVDNLVHFPWVCASFVECYNCA